MIKMIVMIMLLVLAGAIPAKADIKIKDSPQVLDDAVKFGAIQSLTACVRGHMFLITYGKAPVTTAGESYGIAINTVQIYEEKGDKTVPMRCK
jgi:hypothetical protein